VKEINSGKTNNTKDCSPGPSRSPLYTKKAYGKEHLSHVEMCVKSVGVVCRGMTHHGIVERRENARTSRAPRRVGRPGVRICGDPLDVDVVSVAYAVPQSATAIFAAPTYASCRAFSPSDCDEFPNAP